MMPVWLGLRLGQPALGAAPPVVDVAPFQLVAFEPLVAAETPLLATVLDAVAEPVGGLEVHYRATVGLIISGAGAL